MRHFLWSLVLVFLAAAPAWSAPSLTPLNRPFSVSGGMLRFGASDAADSAAIGVSGFCTVRAELQGSDAISLYAITSSSTAASSGTLLKAFSASTSPANPVYTFTASTQWVKAVATSSTTGGSRLVIECSPLVGTGGGSSSDADGDGYYEVAYLWDADGDGSTWTTCTGNATPDIGCKASGERLYRDTIDDLNCAIHGCGLGQMESNGTVILSEGVFVGWPCWTPTNENTPEAHETSDAQHQDASIVTSPAYDDCPVDGDGKRLSVVSFQDWQGTLLGSGADTRLLERGSMSTTLRRDIGTYFVNDMGPWDTTKNNNVWFGGADQYRMISTGFHNNVSDTNHVNGASASDNASSKGWWRIISPDGVATTRDFTTWITDGQTLCLQHSGGTAGTEYKTASTTTNLVPGDVLIIPVKATSGGSYNTFEAIVQATPSANCGSGNIGRWVALGGSYVDRTTGSTKTFPPNANLITYADNVNAVDARDGYDNTRVTIANMRFEPMDPWNEYGGRCTSSGTAWKTTVTSTGTAFSTTTDDTNTDMSCDTLPFFGLWGGGWVKFQDIVVANSHKYAFDAGGTGLADIEGLTFIYGNGQEIADISNGWRFHNVLVDQSYFIAGVFNIFGFAVQIDTVTLRNSVFSNVVQLDYQSPRTIVQNIRNEGNAFLNTIKLACGAQQSTVKDIYQTGRGGNAMAGNSPANVYIECSNASLPVTQNVIENIITDGMDTAQGGESAQVVVFYVDEDNLADGTGDGTDETSSVGWGGIVGNTFRGVRSTGYVGGTAGESSCLYAVGEEGSDSPADDDGESVVFVKNYFEGGSVESNGRVFCMMNNGNANINTTAIDSTGAATPSWGDPLGCGNMDGGAVYADENCI